MKKIPLDPEHRAGQTKIRKMLAAGLPLAALLSGIAACDGLTAKTSGIPPRPDPDPELCEDVRAPGGMPVSKEPRKPKTKPVKPVPLAGVPPPPAVIGKQPRPAVHVVRKGDTLASIARQYGATVAELKKLNGLTGEQADRIKPGQQIKLQ